VPMAPSTIRPNATARRLRSDRSPNMITSRGARSTGHYVWSDVPSGTPVC
jgi:hypothetical protein